MAYNYVELGSLITPSKTVRCGDGVYPVLSMTMHNGLVFQDEKFKKVIASKDTSDYKVVYRNQLVISFPIDEGVLAAQRITDAGIVSPAYGIWDINQSKILPEFLEYALRCDRAIQYYKSKLRGSTARRRTLPTPTLLAFMVPLPCLEEQKMVIDRIHRVQSVIEKRKEQIKKLDDLIKARFVEMFGDPMVNPKGYETRPFGELFELNAGGTPSKAKPEYWEGGTIPWIGSNMCQNVILYENDGKYISQEGYDHSSARLFPIDTVLIALVGATIGKTALLKFETSTNQNVLGVRHIVESGYNPMFVYYYTQFLYQKFMSIGDGGFSMASKGFVSELPMYDIDLLAQNEFATFAKQVDKSKAVVRKSLDENQKLFDGLMQQYFG